MRNITLEQWETCWDSRKVYVHGTVAVLGDLNVSCCVSGWGGHHFRWGFPSAPHVILLLVAFDPLLRTFRGVLLNTFGHNRACRPGIMAYLVPACVISTSTLPHFPAALRLWRVVLTAASMLEEQGAVAWQDLASHGSCLQQSSRNNP